MDLLKKPWIKYSALALVAGLFVWQVIGRSVSADSAAPDFTLTNQHGEQVSLSDYRGKVVVLNFWATWCPPCKAEVPGFNRMYEEYQDDGLVILGVSLDRDGWRSVRPFLTEYNVSYPVVVGNRDIAEAYGNIQSIPTTFVLDKDGEIRQKYVGLREEAVFISDFRRLIKE